MHVYVKRVGKGCNARKISTNVYQALARITEHALTKLMVIVVLVPSIGKATLVRMMLTNVGTFHVDFMGLV